MYKAISRFQFITQDLEEISHQKQAEQACISGVDWIQLRMKDKSPDEALAIAKEVSTICKRFSATFIINDYPEIARESKADGVHLGKQDMSPAEARNLLGEDMIIGGTANTFEDICDLDKQEVDYIGVGPFRFTSTKEKLSPLLGLTGYNILNKQCRDKNIHIPLIAIGGILPEDLTELLQTGVYGVAVSSSVNKAGNKEEVVRKYLEQLLKKIKKD